MFKGKESRRNMREYVCPDKFDPKNKLLSKFINDIAIKSICSDGRPIRNQKGIIKLSNILLEASRELRLSRWDNYWETMPLTDVFHEIYPFGTEHITDAKEYHAKEVANLSEELRVYPKLSKERIKSLRETCKKLSEATSKYYEWNQRVRKSHNIH